MVDLSRREGDTMKKLINDPYAFVDEMLDGIVRAHPGQLRLLGGDKRAVVRADAPVAGKVAICTGGGSGHLPVFMGYVGKGLADGCSIGNVFSSPSPDQMLDATRAVNAGSGVLYLFGNYQGDRLNFGMAAEMAEMEDIHVETVLAADDIASAPRGQESRRRGVAGIFFAYKIAGARAEEGGSLAEVKAAAEMAISSTRSMGMALSPCTIPAVGKPTFEIGDDEMEIGMGIHGEPGVRRGKLESADRVADALLDPILDELALGDGSSVAVLVNGLGATPREELYILYRRVHQRLSELGVGVHRDPYVGEYATSMEMAGASLSVMKLNDELTRLLDAPAHSPFFSQA
jgi:phosphoenolpyruvate---glycerone phosphotransferase subunit DhaK